MDGPVLLTGSEGRVGQAILDGLADRYEWRLLDREPPEAEPPGEFIVGDIADRETVVTAMEGVSAVIHLAGDPRPEAPWDSVLKNNIDGTYAVFRAAVDAGVERVAFASSNHAVKGYELDRQPAIYRSGKGPVLDGSELPRPANVYGVSKATGEVLGRYFHDTADLSVVCVRIGNLNKDRPPAEYERGQAMWLSHRDCAHLFDRCLQAEYGYEIVYGISDNDRKFYSLDRTKEVLGYRPRDNSAEFEDEGVD